MGVSILVVDDEAHVAELFRQQFRRGHCHVAERRSRRACGRHSSQAVATAVRHVSIATARVAPSPDGSKPLVTVPRAEIDPCPFGCR